MSRYSDDPSFDDADGDLRAEFSTSCPLGACDGSGTVRERHGLSGARTDDYDCECRSIGEDPVDDLATIADNVITMRTKEAA